MIYWLLGSCAERPELSGGLPPGGLLSPAEDAWLARLEDPRRRQEWLLGRWVAKSLLQTVLEEQAGVRLPLSSLSLYNGVDGAPDLFLHPESAIQPGVWDSRSAPLSVSFCGGHALCAVRFSPPSRDERDRTARTHIGTGIAAVEPRSTRLADDFFNEAERTALRRAPAAWQEILAGVVWSAKQAALRALHVGLTVDPRRVSCLVGPTPPGGRAWVTLDVRCDPALAAATGSLPLLCSGWWRVVNGYALTLVLLSYGRAPAVGERPADRMSGHLSAVPHDGRGPGAAARPAQLLWDP